MTTLGITSDTHCEHGMPFPEVDDDIDLLILAGDIGCPYRSKSYLMDEIDKPYIYISGNHEHYNYRYSDVISDIFSDDFGGMEKSSVDFQGNTYHACCLWTDLSNPLDLLMYENGLNDCNQIKEWSGNKANIEFQKSLQFLQDNVKKGDIVITHHAPSFQSVNERWKGNLLNPSFTSNLDAFILESKPKLWIHGHMHDSCDYMLGETRVICNPSGYSHEYSKDYKIKKVKV